MYTALKSPTTNDNVSTSNDLEFIRMRAIPERYGISHATACRWIKNGKLPEPKRFSHNCVGWSKATLDAIFFGSK